MADETFEIGIEVTGEGKAGQAFENLKLRELEAKDQASQLSRELRDLKASGDATDAQIEELSRSLIRAKSSAQQYGQEARRVQSAQRAAAQSAQQAARAQDTVAHSSTNAGRNMGAMVNVVAEFGYTMGSAIPGMQTFGTQMAMMGGSAYQLGAALGPVGVVIGVITGAMPMLISAFTSGSESADHMTSSVSGLGTAADEAATRLQQLTQAMADADAEQQRYAGFATTITDVEEGLTGSMNERRALTRQLAEATQRLTDLEHQRQQLLQGDTRHSAGALREVGSQLGEAAREVQRLQQEIRNADEETTLLREGLRRAEQAGAAYGRLDTGESEVGFMSAENRARRIRERQEAAREEESRSRHSSDARRRAAEQAAEAERQQAMRAKEAANEAELYREQLLERRIDAMRDAYAEETRIHNDALDRQFEAELENQQRQRELDEQRKQSQIEKADQAKQQLSETGQITQQMWTNVGGSVLDATGQMLDFIVKGGDVGSKAFQQLLHGFLESTAIRYTITGLAEIAEAAIAAASFNEPGAVAHATAAGLAFAVAGATGLGAAATAPSGGSGGGGAPRPQAGSAAGGGGGGGTTQHVTVQIYAPNAVMTEAERGAMIAGSMREARRQLGPGAVRP